MEQNFKILLVIRTQYNFLCLLTSKSFHLCNYEGNLAKG